MNSFIIGTAGHVDHGKTTLIHCLTGIDADRLPEEKARGMTIDLGFAHFQLPDGRPAAVIDVPGHERFLKNMLAGASGIDFVLLIVAANEGVMPQTREHLDILRLLELKAGVVALTKCDVVDSELLELAIEDVREAVQHSFLAEAPIIPVSGITGEGLDQLREAIAQAASHLEVRDSASPFALWIDRVFSKTGFGTVVTGTLSQGTIQVGDHVEIEPGQIRSRIRHLQVHGQASDRAIAGQRVALALTGVEVSSLTRGQRLRRSAAFPPVSTSYLDAHIQLLSQASLLHHERVRVHIGTAEALARVVLLQADDLASSSSGFIQLQLEEPVAAHPGDRFVLRRYSPPDLIGGGSVIFPAVSHRQRWAQSVEDLQEAYEGDWKGAAIARLRQQARPYRISELPFGGDWETAIADLIDSGEVIQAGEAFIARETLKVWVTRLREFLGQEHRRSPHRIGPLSRDAMKALHLEPHWWEPVFAHAIETRIIRRYGGHIALSGHQPLLAQKLQKLQDALSDMLQRSPLHDRAELMRELEQIIQPSRHYVAGRHVETPLGTEIMHLIENAVATGELVILKDEICATREGLGRAIAKLRDHLTDNPDGISASQARELVSGSRKLTIPFLEYCDREGITRRDGDLRFLS